MTARDAFEYVIDLKFIPRGKEPIALLVFSVVSAIGAIIALASESVSGSETAMACAVGTGIGLFALVVGSWRDSREPDMDGTRKNELSAVLRNGLSGLSGLLIVYVVASATFGSDRWFALAGISSAAAVLAAAGLIDNRRAGHRQTERARQEPDELDPRLSGRRIAVAVWICVWLAVAVLGVINGSFGTLEVGYVVAGLLTGGLLGSILSFILLLPGDSSPTGTRPGTHQSIMGIGARSLLSILIAGSCVVLFADGEGGVADGPIDLVASLTAAGMAVCATSFDLFVAAPRRFAGEHFDPARISDGGQDGLAHRGELVACWVAAITVVLPPMLFGWFVTGVAEVNLTEGTLFGVALGGAFAAAYAIASRGSLEARVRRHQRFANRKAATTSFLIIGGFFAMLAGLSVLIEELGFNAGCFAMIVALIVGLIATIVDRWILVPRLMRASDDNLPPSPAIEHA